MHLYIFKQISRIYFTSWMLLSLIWMLSWKAFCKCIAFIIYDSKGEMKIKILENVCVTLASLHNLSAAVVNFTYLSSQVSVSWTVCCSTPLILRMCVHWLNLIFKENMSSRLLKCTKTINYIASIFCIQTPVCSLQQHLKSNVFVRERQKKEQEPQMDIISSQI